MNYYILGGACLLFAWTFFLIAFFYDLGYQRGKREEEQWWINQEAAVDLERQKIWRESGGV